MTKASFRLVGFVWFQLSRRHAALQKPYRRIARRAERQSRFFLLSSIGEEPLLCLPATG
jgi:hypothetical protein